MHRQQTESYFKNKAVSVIREVFSDVQKSDVLAIFATSEYKSRQINLTGIVEKKTAARYWSIRIWALLSTEKYLGFEETNMTLIQNE